MHKVLKTLCFLLFSYLASGQRNDGPVAKYSFNAGNARDEAGKNDAKTIGVSLVNDRFDNPKSAYYLQGSLNSYINLGTSPVLKPKAGTISMWVKMDNIAYKGKGITANPFILTKSHGGNDFFEGYFMGYTYNNHKININISPDSVRGAQITSTDTFSLRTWHHLVMAYDDKYLWLYMDGVMQNDNAPMAKNFRSQFLETDSVVIGTMANTKNVRGTNGSVDDIEIYDRVLSQDEVYDLYHAPNPNKNQIYWLWTWRLTLLLLVFAMAVWLIARRYNKALAREQEKNRVNTRLIELETKAIRTQMNPHFMFNSLNTLQRFILEEDTKGAHLYLSKFSKLLRKILESSTMESISLSEELDILNSYVDIERLRFSNSFNYNITSTVPDPDHCYIPFLLIQPFVENAIWHGLLPMKDNRSLGVHFSYLDEKKILCVIEDNGVGRAYSNTQRDPLKKKSLAIEFIKQRLELLSKSTNTVCTFTIIDKKDRQGQSAGTRVEIVIPRLNLI